MTLPRLGAELELRRSGSSLGPSQEQDRNPSLLSGETRTLQRWTREGLAVVTLSYRLVWKGYRRPLGPKDLWSLGSENSSAELVSQLEKEWTRNRSATQR